mmetsp:Transcript_78626/g.212855  ORF Transcript_78626/g.212855 Transcript_78626/m.212855 type:complete len:335 (-) Transcript_78626:107-1111(-)
MFRSTVASTPRAAIWLICASIAQSLVLDTHVGSEEATVPGAQLKRHAIVVADGNTHLYKPLRDILAKQPSAPVIYFFGDSTMRNQWLAFCSIISASSGEEIADPNPEGGAIMRLEENHKVASRNFCNSTIGAAFLYHTWEPMEPGFVEKVISWGYPAPTGIYLNSGLHILRGLGPRGLDWNRQRYEEFRGLEAAYTATVQRCSEVAPAARIALMLSHCICEDFFTGAWGQEVADYKSDPVKATRNCTSELIGEGVGAADAQAGCIESAFTRGGILQLNNRLLAASKELQGKAPGIVDAFSLTDGMCNATFDGVHYNYHVLNELSMAFDAMGIAL